MGKLGQKEFWDRDGNHYLLEIDFDDAAIMDHKLVAVVSATKFEPSGEVKSTDARISLDTEKEQITVQFDEIEPFIIQLNESAASSFDDEERDFTQESEMNDFLSQMLGSGGAIDHLRSVIEYVPVGEPALGCIIKAGVSTTLGQAVQCHFLSRDVDPVRRRIWAILRCMGKNSPVVLAKASLRTLRCWIALGIA